MFVLEAQNLILDNRLTPSSMVIFVVVSELHFERSIYSASKSVSTINLWAIIQVLRVAKLCHPCRGWLRHFQSKDHATTPLIISPNTSAS